jgi:hypothetical protein
MSFAFTAPAPRMHAPHAAAVCARVKQGSPMRCPEPAALETFGFPAVPSVAVRGPQDIHTQS